MTTSRVLRAAGSRSNTTCMSSLNCANTWWHLLPDFLSGKQKTSLPLRIERDRDGFLPWFHSASDPFRVSFINHETIELNNPITAGCRFTYSCPRFCGHVQLIAHRRISIRDTSDGSHLSILSVGVPTAVLLLIFAYFYFEKERSDTYSPFAITRLVRSRTLSRPSK